MTSLSDFAAAVAAKLLARDHPVLHVLRMQAGVARNSAIVATGVGFYWNYDVPIDAATPPSPLNFEVGDVEAAIDGLQHGAGFVLFVRDGRLAWLEGYTYDEPWPQEIHGFELRYDDEPASRRAERQLPGRLDSSFSKVR